MRQVEGDGVAAVGHAEHVAQRAHRHVQQHYDHHAAVEHATRSAERLRRRHVVLQCDYLQSPENDTCGHDPTSADLALSYNPSDTKWRQILLKDWRWYALLWSEKYPLDIPVRHTR